MTFTKLAALGGMLALLSACSVTQNLQDLRTTPRAGSDFSKALADEYLAFAESEAIQADWIDQAHFAGKGLRATRVETVLPEPLADWDLPAEHVPALTQARADLVSILDASARTKFPKDAAHAQAMFDCWVEQQEENHQLDHIAACRDGFHATMEKLRGLMAPPAPTPAVAPARAAQANFLVFFDFNSAVVTPEAEQSLRLAIDRAAAYGTGPVVSVVGHTDASGGDAYNRALGMRRAEAVAAKLTELGLKAVSVSTVSVGESDPLVPTADGVREPQNRRATVTLR